ncbi:heparinase II/III domain-containing protein [Microbacterium proteolyticum]|uniref:heparinase II/III domain-containing protein n=1 Tax=Microbacterium proteolyticum TaxID=1572644 RepID=UPI001FABFBAF|nr:heparinase II/III family protein [Microbacterium proteolyticum]MCI9858556.1 heparinase II/III family protein [Microbacterium proteolyticum]
MTLTPSSHAAYSGVLAEFWRAQDAVGAGDNLADALRRTLRPPEDALPVAPAHDRAVWGAHGTADQSTVAAVLSRASDDLGTSWPVALASAAARVHGDGDRESWESVVFERQRRLSRAVVAAAVTEEGRWLDEVLDGVWLLCEQSSWCWPAHDDAHAVGSVLAIPDRPFLDLGAGEVAAQLAWVDHLVGEALETAYPGVRARVRREVRRRVFDSFTTRRDWHWIGLDGDVHNWNPWIHGNVITAALRLLDGPGEREERGEIIALALEGMDRYVTALPLDGAIDEGYGYWWNGACRALEALDVVSFATEGHLDAAEVPALSATVAFPHRSHLGGDWYLNLADGQAKPPSDQPWHALHRSARAVGDDDAVAHAASHRRPGVPAATETFGLGRLLRGMTDTDWIEAAAVPPPLIDRVWLPSTEVLLARGRSGSTAGLTVAVKGGHNGEHHNHNDVGSFVLASDGVPVVVDVGRPTYTKQTFGPDRYDIWTMQSAWHNTPVIDGQQQSPGPEYRARDVTVTLDEATVEWSADLAGAYPDGAAASWQRHVSFGEGRVRVRDEWRSAVGAAHRWHLVLAGKVDVDADGATASVRPLSGATPVVIRWPAGVRSTVTRRTLEDPLLTDVWGTSLTRLELDVSDHPDVVVTFETHPATTEEIR